MHSMTTPVRLVLGACLAAAIMVSGTMATTAAATTTTKVVPAAASDRDLGSQAAARGSVALRSAYGCNPSRRERCYGAIYYSPGHDAVGYSYDYKTGTYAKRKAKAQCVKYGSTYGCRHLTTFWNSCAALAVTRWSTGEIRRYAWAYGYQDQWDAVRAAKKKAGTGSKTRTWVCTTRYRS